MPDQPPPLLLRVAQGEEDAVQECIDTFGRLVWGLARRLSPNAEDAADAVQEIFIELWKNAHKYNAAIGSETTYVAVLARRRLIDRLRKHGRQPKVAPLSAAIALPAESTGDPVERSEEAARAARVVATLRPDEQQVIKLAVCEGWTHSQIADQLDMPLGTVKTHVRRGLIKVREAMRGQG